jgi:hypothetical protein
VEAERIAAQDPTAATLKRTAARVARESMRGLAAETEV